MRGFNSNGKPCGSSTATPTTTGPSSSPVAITSTSISMRPTLQTRMPTPLNEGLIRMLIANNSTNNATIIITNATTTTLPPTTEPQCYLPSGINLWAIGLTLGGGLTITFLTVLAFGIAVIYKHKYIAPRCTSRHPNTIWRSRKDMYGDNNGSGSVTEFKSDNRGEESSSSRRALSPNTLAEQSEMRIEAEASKRVIHGSYNNHHNNINHSEVELTDSWNVKFKEHKEDNELQSSHLVHRRRSSNEADASQDPTSLSNEHSNNEHSHSSSNSNSNSNSNNNLLYAHPQDRGNPFLGWIPWTLHLSYDRMLRGIPGTGTREGGMSGKLLGVNLDAIVLFRFHALCLRVTAVVCFFCIGLILPLNITACQLPECNANLTDYGQTTVANVVHKLNETSVWSTDTTTSNNSNVFSSIFWTDQSLPHLLRLYVISMITWYITYFTLKNIKRDWRENLVLRRVYYLEADHYGNRESELDKTMYKPHNEDEEDEDEDEVEGTTKNRIKKRRDPWIPHPEHRETVSNIELYSVLVGGLPSLPDEVVNSKDRQVALGVSKRASIDWQLQVATTFFDHCVPNQPGFSSSVVAVTILPGAPELAKAWRKWYAAAAALRRLRFIRQLIEEKRYYEIDDVDEELGSGKSSDLKPTGESDNFGESEFQPNNFDGSQYSARDGPSHSKQRVTFRDHESSAQCEDFDTGGEERSFGEVEDSTDRDYQIFRSLNYGPEQQAVYSREMAQGAGACCPNGCHEERVMRYPIDRLLVMEDETILRLEKAQHELQCAQMQAAVSIVDGGDKSTKKSANQLDIDDSERVFQSNNPHGDSISSPKRLFSGSAKASVAEKEAGPPSGNKDLTVLTSGTGFSQSADGQSLILGIPPRTPGFSSENDQNFGNPNLVSHSAPMGGNLYPDPRLLQTALPIVKEGIGHEGSASQDFDVDTKFSAPHSNPSVQNLNGGSSASSKNSIFKSPNANRSTTVLRMNSEGRFLFNNETMDEDEEASRASRAPLLAPALRRRANTAQSALSVGDVSRSSNQWNQVNSILRTNDADEHPEIDSSSNKREIETGVWQKPSLKSFMSSVKSGFLFRLRAIGTVIRGKTDPLASKLAKDSTYAVVTFSSRQAAVAARHCLADGRGVERWLSLETVPVPPLADAAPCDIITCRGCCRPVTLNLNHNQLMIRRYIALASLAFIYIFYTIPISYAQSLVSPTNLEETLPAFNAWIANTPFISAEIMSGLVAALLYTTFFALCPVLFKAIANSGSRATSLEHAEKFALQYYWYFMLVTAFVFTGLADTAMTIWKAYSKDNSGIDVESEVEKLIEEIAAQTPLTTAATWLNWIIVRTTMTLPLHYLLGVNTFVFNWIGWKCCARCVIGGGPGGPIPYRIYVDGGVVFLCVVALAPQSPLVAPAALLYFLVCVPLWRRNCIFMYRPKFDSGGERWPFLSDMLIASLFMGQFLLTLQMVLRDAYGPALMAAFPAVPTFLYRNYLIKRFRKAYEDAGLLQTSLLDGWDNTIPTSVEKREEFRQFLVDAHKAAYIPVCIAGGATNILTAEPALVLASDDDDMLGYGDVSVSEQSDALADTPLSPYFGDQANLFPNGMRSDSEGISTPTMSNQRGTCVRRTMSLSANTPRSAGTSVMADRGADSPRSSSTLWQKVQDQVDISSADAVDPGCAQS